MAARKHPVIGGTEVRLARVPGRIPLSEPDPWEGFEEACRQLGDGFFDAMASRDRFTTRIPAKQDVSK